MSNSKNSKRGRPKKTKAPNIDPDELKEYAQDIGEELEEKNDIELKMKQRTWNSAIYMSMVALVMLERLVNAI